MRFIMMVACENEYEALCYWNIISQVARGVLFKWIGRPSMPKDDKKGKASVESTPSTTTLSKASALVPPTLAPTSSSAEEPQTQPLTRDDGEDFELLEKDVFGELDDDKEDAESNVQVLPSVTQDIVFVSSVELRH